MINEVAIYGGETLHKIEITVPVQILIKEKSSFPESGLLNEFNTYAWKIDYKGRMFGSYIALADDISNRQDKGTQEFLKEVYSLMMEQAEEAYLHRILLTETANEDIFSELQERLDKKYYPVWLTTDRKYCVKDDSGKKHWHKKLSYKYFVIATRRWFVIKVLNILKGLL
jgi:hypothetical protein